MKVRLLSSHFYLVENLDRRVGRLVFFISFTMFGCSFS